jgi:hypothetical protein
MDRFATEPGSAVACRNAAQVPEWARVEDTVVVPVPAVVDVNPVKFPDSKLFAITVVPGLVSDGTAVPGWHVAACAGTAPAASAEISAAVVPPTTPSL